MFGSVKLYEESLEFWLCRAFTDRLIFPFQFLEYEMEDETWFDAAKAIELGFADGLLNERHEENAPASALFFSRRAADRALVNKIVSQIPVQPLYDRLERLKSETAG